MEGIESRHVMEDGMVLGGSTRGTGMVIKWQDGTLGRGDGKKKPNGAQVEEVIEAAIGRLEAFQASKFANTYNERSLQHLKAANKILNDRTKEREERGVEGTHEL